ncbi:MAG: ATP-dependent Clp protease ATP-binding subunit ClpC, partial [Actinomycetota bacterium]|nr:ATP-dependent Clp protease ATP-binding subunit ClpC [Actinomycetota bacterium]
GESEGDRQEEVRERLLEELGTYFRPEFLNRVDEIIVFHSLGDEELVEIAGLLLDSLRETAKRQGIHMTFSDAAIERIALEGRNSRFGARPLRRAVSKLVESPLSKEIIAGHVEPHDTVRLDVNGEGHIVFETGESSSPATPSFSAP